MLFDHSYLIRGCCKKVVKLLALDIQTEIENSLNNSRATK